MGEQSWVSVGLSNEQGDAIKSRLFEKITKTYKAKRL